MVLIFMALGAALGTLSAILGVLFFEMTLLAGFGLYFCITLGCGALGVVAILGQKSCTRETAPDFGWTRPGEP